MTTKEVAKTALVEFLGTFAIIYFGTLSAKEKVKTNNFQMELTQNSLLNFFLIMSFVWISSKKFGAQLNPLFSLY